MNEAAADTARAAARAFLDAIVDGDHPGVWEMLHPRARERAVSVALGQGLDRVKAERFLHGNADPAELAEFQREVVGGLRRDFRSVELERLTVGPTSSVDAEDDVVTVGLSSPSSLPRTDGWYAGRLRLQRVDDGSDEWCVVDVEPAVTGS